MKFTPTLAVALSLLTSAALQAQSGFTTDKTPSGGVIVKQDGKLFAEYIVDQANKPYLAPVFGPAGKQMTRNYPMKTIDGETHDHPHHRGICFGHEEIGGIEFWAEKKTYDEMNAKKPGTGDVHLAKLGSTKHRAYELVKAGQDGAVIDDIIDWLDPNGKKLLEEHRRMYFHAADGTWIIDMDQDLIASEGAVRVEDRKDAGLSIRVPTSMAVDSKLGGKTSLSCDRHGEIPSLRS